MIKSNMKNGKKVERTRPELLEMIQRQEKILANKSFISKLPDKGEKIKIAYKKLLSELAGLDAIDASCKLFSSLNISSDNKVPDKVTVENIEWNNRTNHTRNECLDSDDDSDPEDPLTIIASNTDVKKKIIQLKEPEKLINTDDLREIEEFKSENGFHINPHTEYICNITDPSKSTARESFKPYKTLIPNSRKVKSIHENTHWEVTAATPPPILHEPIKMITIKESLNLQDVQSQQLKKIQLQHASEKLAALSGGFVSRLPPIVTDKNIYREVTDGNSDSEDSDRETSDQEVYDDEPKEGGVVFTITN